MNAPAVSNSSDHLEDLGKLYEAANELTSRTRSNINITTLREVVLSNISLFEIKTSYFNFLLSRYENHARLQIDLLQTDLDGMLTEAEYRFLSPGNTMPSTQEDLSELVDYFQSAFEETLEHFTYNRRVIQERLDELRSKGTNIDGNNAYREKEDEQHERFIEERRNRMRDFYDFRKQSYESRIDPDEALRNRELDKEKAARISSLEEEMRQTREESLAAINEDIENRRRQK